MTRKRIIMQRDGVENPAGLSRKRKTAVNAFLLIIACFAALIAADVYVASFSKGRLYDNPADIPHRRAAVVLGCGKYIQAGNLFYLYWSMPPTCGIGQNRRCLVSATTPADYAEPTAMADTVENTARVHRVDYADFERRSVIRQEVTPELRRHLSRSLPPGVYLPARQMSTAPPPMSGAATASRYGCAKPSPAPLP